MADVSSGEHKRKREDKACKITKKKWTQKEDVVLIAALSEMCNAGWKRENGIFKNGYTAALERKLKSRLPGCNIKASPHIESRLKLLKRQYDAITEMQGAAGMQWDEKENILICEDDDVWEDWIRTHTDARGLRNKQFPYYDDLHFLFGNRGTRKGNNNGLDGDKLLDDEENDAPANLMVGDSLEEDDRGNYEAFQNGSFDEVVEHYKKRKAQRDRTRNASNSNDEGATDRPEDSNGTNGSNDDNLLTDANVRTEMQHRASTTKVLAEKSCNNESGSSEFRELAKIFGTFLDKYQEHLSLLAKVVGKETAAEKRAGEKRARLNGELAKLPNLNLQARLRAASLMVTDPAKLDLFYSLSEEERTEWVSMLLSGLI